MLDALVVAPDGMAASAAVPGSVLTMVIHR
jgi:hypothetical protein